MQLIWTHRFEKMWFKIKPFEEYRSFSKFSQSAKSIIHIIFILLISIPIPVTSFFVAARK